MKRARIVADPGNLSVPLHLPPVAHSKIIKPGGKRWAPYLPQRSANYPSPPSETPKPKPSFRDSKMRCDEPILALHRPVERRGIPCLSNSEDRTVWKIMVRAFCPTGFDGGKRGKGRGVAVLVVLVAALRSELR
jgi:hypothetical protein